MTQLTHDELSSLIDAYESELRKLSFRVDLTTKTLEELYVLLRDKSESKLESQQQVTPEPVAAPEPVSAPAPSPAPEPTPVAEVAMEAPEPKSAPKPRKKRSKIDASTPPPGIQTGKGYRLSEWDNVVLHAVHNANYPLTYNEIFEDSMKYVNQNGIDLIEPQVKGKINRSLQKLVVRRGTLVKLPFDGRGYTYGLNHWMDEAGALSAGHDRPEE